MRIVIDTNLLIVMASADPSKPLTNPATKEPLDRVADRFATLLEIIDRANGRIIIPTPVLAEFLVGIESKDIEIYIDGLTSSSAVEVVAFDRKAAIECALLVNAAEKLQIKSDSDTKAKVRFDRQIIAIAKSINADAICTHDINLAAKAKEVNLVVTSLADYDPAPQQDDWVGEEDSGDETDNGSNDSEI